jgi:3-oxoacyl-[acyl-carrier-protein] synthase-1
MSPDSAVIIGIGMVTPLGLNAPQSAASIRAGLSAFEETSIMDKAFNPFVLATIPDEELPELNPDLEKELYFTFRESRLLKLAQMALSEILEPLRKIKSNDIPIYIGLPELKTNIPLDSTAIIRRFSKQISMEFDKRLSHGYINGRAAGLMAINDAMTAIRNGETQIALAGGVDSYKDLYILGTLDMEKRVNSAQNMDGFIPGEGACFLLLATQEFASNNNCEFFGNIVATAVGHEPGHLYSEEPYRGDGLAAVFEKLIGSNSGKLPPIQTIFSSMNGENHFAKEWGVAYIRNKEHIAEEFRIEHPADCIGDTGAASGPIMIGLALAGFRKEYLKAPALIYASSDYGDRAACIVNIS